MFGPGLPDVNDCRVTAVYGMKDAAGTHITRREFGSTLRNGIPALTRHRWARSGRGPWVTTQPKEG